MNCKIYRGIIFILAIASIWQLATAVGDIFGSRYQYYFEKDSFFYNIEDEEYWYLPRERKANMVSNIPDDAQMLECYAVADYYEAASLYYAYENIGNIAKAAIAKADMEEAKGRMGGLSYCAEEIDGYFVKYFASADSESQSSDVEGQSTEAQ